MTIFTIGYFQRNLRVGVWSLMCMLLSLSLAAVPAAAAEPVFEQILHAGNTTVLLEHGGKVLRGLDGGGIIVFDRGENRETDRWTAGDDLTGNFISDMVWTGQNIWIATIGSGMTRVTDLNSKPVFRQYLNNLGDLDISAVTGAMIGDGERVFYGMFGKGVGQINSGLSGNIYTAEEDGLISNDITALEMLGGDLFVGTTVGISRFANNAFTDQNDGLSNLVINDLMVDADGNLLAASDAGIHQWDNTGESWSLLGDIGTRVVGLAGMEGKVFALGRTLAGNGVLSRYDGASWSPLALPHAQCTAIDAGEDLWIGGPAVSVSGGGKLTFNYIGRLQGDGTFDTRIAVSTQVSNCVGAAIGSDGTVWMGDSFGFQITRYDPRDNSYQYVYERPHAANDTLNLFPGLGNVLSILGAPDGTVYASQFAAGGVLKFNPATWTNELMDPDNSGLQGRRIINLVAHPDGPVFVLHNHEDAQRVEILVEPENWADTASWVLPPMDQGLGSGLEVGDALVERRDIIWFAVKDLGLVRWDVNGPDAGPDDPLTWFDPGDDVWYDPVTDFPGSKLEPKFVEALTLGRDGSLWVGGNGLVQFTYELTTGTSLSVDVVREFEEKRRETPNVEGLVNGSVKDLATDNNGDIWVATVAGLNRVSPRGDEAQVAAWFDVGNYLSNDDYGLIYSRSVISPLPGQTYFRIVPSLDGKRMVVSSDRGATLITVGSGPSSGGSDDDPLRNIYCYPNPWSPGQPAPRLKLAGLPSGAVQVGVFNVEGQEVMRDKTVAEGVGFWEGANKVGNPVASGMYILKITSGGRTTTRIVALER